MSAETKTMRRYFRWSLPARANRTARPLSLIHIWGEDYARKECTNPTRIVTSTVPVDGGEIPQVSVKTASDIPKSKIFACMAELKKIRVKAPVRIGDVVLANAAGSGVDVIATKDVLGR